eukprot:Selendium_serpulae@DN5280_c0_g3_i1.p1
MPANARLNALIQLVQQLNRNKAELDRQLTAAHESLVAAVAELVVQLVPEPIPEADDGGPSPPPPMPESRRLRRAMRFGHRLPETTYGSPSLRGSRRGTIEKHEGGQSLGKPHVLCV